MNVIYAMIYFSYINSVSLWTLTRKETLTYTHTYTHTCKIVVKITKADSGDQNIHKILIVFFYQDYNISLTLCVQKLIICNKNIF